DDIEQTLGTGIKAAHILLNGHPIKPMLPSRISVVYGWRSQHLGEILDTEKSVACERRVAELTPNGHPRLPLWLSNLCMTHGLRFEQLGEMSDLELSASTGKQAIDLTPDGDEPLIIFSYFFFLFRFTHGGQATDLVEALPYGREALTLTPDGRSLKPAWSLNLGEALIAAFVLARSESQEFDLRENRPDFPNTCI
ncbi:hypothetical protein BDY19DRAFT_893907, partial [Irpex rosettiformis]